MCLCMRASLCVSHVFFLAFIYFGHTIRLARISVPHPETVPGPQKWEARILTTSHQRTPTSFYSFVGRHSGCFRSFTSTIQTLMDNLVCVSFCSCANIAEDMVPWLHKRHYGKKFSKDNLFLHWTVLALRKNSVQRNCLFYPSFLKSKTDAN